MIEKNMPQHAIKIFGENGAFELYKEAKDWANVIRNENPQNYYVGLNNSFEILRPHYHVTACILAGHKETNFLTCNEPAPDYGDKWLGDYPKKQLIVDFYNSIPELFFNS